MNCGLGNLDLLRKSILGTSLAGETKFDDILTAVGLGVAALLDTHCNRRFAFAEDDIIIFSGDRPHYYLPRFPLVKITTVQMRYFLADNWTDITGQPISWNPQTGQLHFGYTLGRNPLQVRVTYSGGYCFETLEPDDEGYPSARPAAIAQGADPGTGQQPLPAESYDLPKDVQLAWLLQCKAVWASIDKLGVDILAAGASGNFVTGTQWSLELTPIVKQMLNAHIRYQLT